MRRTEIGYKPSMFLEAEKVRHMLVYWQADCSRICGARMMEAQEVERLLGQLQMQVTRHDLAKALMTIETLEYRLAELGYWLVWDVPNRMTKLQWTQAEPRQLVNQYVASRRRLLVVWRREFERQLAQAGQQSTQECSVSL